MIGILNNFIYDVIHGIYDFLNVFLPVFSLSNLVDFTEGYSWLIQLIYSLSFVLPVPTIMNILGLTVSIHVTLFALWIVNWFMKAILDIIP